jgi:hypothetical protein
VRQVEQRLGALDDVVHGAGAHGPQRRGGVAKSGQHHHRRAGRQRMRLEEGDRFAVRQPPLGQHEVVSGVGQSRLRGGDGGGNGNLRAGPRVAERALDQRDAGRVILHQQNRQPPDPLCITHGIDPHGRRRTKAPRKKTARFRMAVAIRRTVS